MYQKLKNIWYNAIANRECIVKKKPGAVNGL